MMERPAVLAWLRRHLPVAFGVASLLLTGILALQAYRSLRGHQQTAEALLADYAAFAAWGFRQHAEERLAAILQPVLNVPTSWDRSGVRGPQSGGRQTGELASRMLRQMNRAGTGCACGEARVEAAYAFEVEFSEDPSPSIVGAEPDVGVLRWLADTLTRHGRSVYRSDWRFAIVHGEPVSVAYALAETRAGDTVAYGIPLEPASLGPVFAEVLRNRILLPPSLTATIPNDSLLTVTIAAPRGANFFRSRESSAGGFSATEVMDDRLGSLPVQVHLQRPFAEQLVIGGFPSQRLPWLIAVFLAATALLIGAVAQLRRERELIRLRSNFVMSVSHELRTPLSQIRLFAETLRLGRAATGEQRRWALGVIERETERLADMVSNILRVGNLERGQQNGRPREALGLADVLRDTVRAFEPLARSRENQLDLQVEEEVAVVGSREELRQVVLNLLDNAVRYGPAGQTVGVTLRRSNGWAELLVDDEGPGVPPRNRDRLWEAFWRGADHGSGGGDVGSDRSPGCGLGLAVVREIVERHGGRVWIEDVPGGGARFGVSLPLEGWKREDSLASAIAQEASPTSEPHAAVRS